MKTNELLTTIRILKANGILLEDRLNLVEVLVIFSLSHHYRGEELVEKLKELHMTLKRDPNSLFTFAVGRKKSNGMGTTPVAIKD